MVKVTARQNLPPPVMEVVTDPVELARARAQRERFDRNWRYYANLGPTVLSQYRGKYVCVSGAQLFVADSVAEALTLAKAAYPEDDGRFVERIPLENTVRAYAYQRTVD